MKQRKKKIISMGAALFAVAVMVLLVPHFAMAGADTTFDPIWQTVASWIQGSLGRMVAGAFVIIGLVYGAARQSVMGFATGTGAGIGLASSPNIIDNMVSATLPAADAAHQVINLLY